jgi:hypothetical protein
MIEWAKKCNIPIGFRKPADCAPLRDSINSLERDPSTDPTKAQLRAPRNGVFERRKNSVRV